MSFKSALTLILSLTLSGAMFAQDSAIKNETLIQVGDLEITEDYPHFLETIAGLTDLDVSGMSLIYKLKDKSYRLVETTHLNRYFAVEGAIGYYDKSQIFGTRIDSSTEVSTLNNIELNAKYATFDLFAQATIPIFRDYISAYVKAGGNFTRAEFKMVTTSSPFVVSEKETTTVNKIDKENSATTAYGYGLLGVISKSIVIRLDYTEFELNQVEANTTSLGIGFRY